MISREEEPGVTTPLLSSTEPGVTTPLLSSTNASITSSQSVAVSVAGSGGSGGIVAESPLQYKRRWRRIRMMYYTMFLGAVNFTIVMSTIWPYLKVVDEDATPSLLGYVVASYSLGQLVASPFFGFWSARRGTTEPLLVSLVLQIGSSLLYAYVQSIKKFYSGSSFLIIARVLMGFSSGNAAVVRAYVSGSTTLSERTGAMAMVSIFQSMGFILGPFLQTALVELQYPGPVEKDWFHFNMYTAPAFLSALFTLVNVVLVIFIRPTDVSATTGTVTNVNTTLNSENDEDEVQEEEDREREKGKEGSRWSRLLKSIAARKETVSTVAISSILGMFFCTFFVFTIFETIGTPLTMDMYGWTKSVASRNNGLILGGAGLVSIVDFYAVITLSKKGVDERRLLLAGFTFCFIGFFGLLPWGHDLPFIAPAPINIPSTTTPASLGHVYTSPYPALLTNWTFISPSPTEIPHLLNTTQAVTNTTVSPRGCPWYFGWCGTVPKIQLWQFFLGTFFITIGYATCNCMVYAIYSKILPPGPQGIWMGVITAFGSASRMLGPVFVSQIYDLYGPRATFASTCGILLLAISCFLLSYRRVVPYDKQSNSKRRKDGNIQSQEEGEGEERGGGERLFRAPTLVNGSVQ